MTPLTGDSAAGVVLGHELGRTPVGTMWSCTRHDGIPGVIEVIDLAGPHRGSLEVLHQLTYLAHPHLALPGPLLRTPLGPGVVLDGALAHPLPPLDFAGPDSSPGQVAEQLFDALDALHAAGLRHNAISPSLLCHAADGTVMLAVTGAVVLPGAPEDDIAALERILGRRHPQPTPPVAPVADMASPISSGGNRRDVARNTALLTGALALIPAAVLLGHLSSAPHPSTGAGTRGTAIVVSPSAAVAAETPSTTLSIPAREAPSAEPPPTQVAPSPQIARKRAPAAHPVPHHGASPIPVVPTVTSGAPANRTRAAAVVRGSVPAPRISGASSRTRSPIAAAATQAVAPPP